MHRENRCGLPRRGRLRAEATAERLVSFNVVCDRRLRERDSLLARSSARRRLRRLLLRLSGRRRLRPRFVRARGGCERGECQRKELFSHFSPPFRIEGRRTRKTPRRADQEDLARRRV